jgi:putative addiction module killer protein
MRLIEYQGPDGGSPFAKWFEKLESRTAARVAASLARMEAGNLSNAKSVGSGVHELRIDFGPGFRVYFGRDGAELVILLAGGTKRRQQEDIERARRLWLDYRRRKKDEA